MNKVETDKKLNAKQEKFCKLYATKEDFFGNGVQAYAEAFGLNLNKKQDYNTAKANASRLLTNANILTRINNLLEELGLNNERVDKELCFLITQRVDLNVKLRAIQEYNRLKARHKLSVDLNTKKTFDVNISNYQAYHELLEKQKTEELTENDLIRLVNEQNRYYREVEKMI